MKKYLLLFPALVLIGAGCTGSTQVRTETSATRDADVQAEQSTTTTTENDPKTEAKADAEINVTTKDGAEIKLEVKTEKNDEIKTETTTSVEIKPTETVPVTDVVLGGETKMVEMEAGNFFFKPNVINASAGEKIKINFTKNSGFHTFVIAETQQKFSIVQGESVSFTAPDKAGTYTFYCDVGSHRAMGQEGTLIVK